MNPPNVLRLVQCVALVSAIAGCAARPVESPQRTDSPVETGIATLYFNDPLSNTIGFESGREGKVFHDHMVKNRNSDIDFGTYNTDTFTVGIEGGRRGAIIDLGSAADLQKQYGYAETVGGGQGFASLRLEGNTFVILKDYDKQTTQMLQGADSLFGPLSEKHGSAPIHNGHVYLLRLDDRHDPKFERIVKFIVLSYTPKESVTIRWVRLRG